MDEYWIDIKWGMMYLMRKREGQSFPESLFSDSPSSFFNNFQYYTPGGVILSIPLVVQRS